IVAVSAFSRLHVFTSGESKVGFIDVLPAERVAPLQFPACPAPPTGPPTGPPASPVTGLDQALFDALAVDGRTPYAELATATGWSGSRGRPPVGQLRTGGG